jgi:hypothetical protein
MVKERMALGYPGVLGVYMTELEADKEHLSIPFRYRPKPSICGCTPRTSATRLARLGTALKFRLRLGAGEGSGHLVLREYRNLVHPRLELQLGLPISKYHAGVAVNMLDVVLDNLK